MKKLLVLVLVALFVLSGTSAFAAQSGKYPMGPIQKLERGAGNLFFGWTELPKRVVDQTKASNPIKGALLGGWQGTCRALARTVSGAFDIGTFPLKQGTSYDDPLVLPDMPAAK